MNVNDKLFDIIVQYCSNIWATVQRCTYVDILFTVSRYLFLHWRVSNNHDVTDCVQIISHTKDINDKHLSEVLTLYEDY